MNKKHTSENANDSNLFFFSSLATLTSRYEKKARVNIDEREYTIV